MYKATYLGRPVTEFVGSGLHINFSSRARRGWLQLLRRPARTPSGHQFARPPVHRGLVAHHEAVSAFSAPLINSYKRLQPGMIAATGRTGVSTTPISTYRIPEERGAATRIENRMPCGTANPYLAAAAMLNAALLGVVDGLDCGAPQIGDGDTEPNTDRHNAPHARRGARRARGRLPAVRGDGRRPRPRVPGDPAGRARRWEAAGETWDPETYLGLELTEYLPFY